MEVGVYVDKEPLVLELVQVLAWAGSLAPETQSCDGAHFIKISWPEECFRDPLLMSLDR